MEHKDIVIVGGGFSGVFIARRLARLFRGRGPSIELISEHNYFIFQPLLPEVAAGIIQAQDAVAPLRLLLRNTKIRLAEVHSVDLDANTLYLLQGSKKLRLPLGYKHLVLAPGQITDLSRNPGFEDHCLRMRSLADAHNLRNRVIQCLELAEASRNEPLRRMALSFVVIGGGFSGVETIGEIADMIRRMLPFYPSVRWEDLSLLLLHNGDRILQELPAKLSAYAQRKLRQRGVQILLKTRALRATATSITTDKGATLESLTVVTTVGNGPSPFVRTLPLSLERGKIPVDAQLRLPGRDNVWAAGDAALVPLGDGYAPPTAQFAVREARCLADNLHAAWKGRRGKSFHYRPQGALASLGHYTGVARVFGVSISGLAAWFLWRALYIFLLPGLVTKLRVSLNWLFDYFLPRTMVQIASPHPTAVRYQHYREGDTVFSPGQLIAGFYVVVSGTLQMRVQQDDGQDFLKTFQRGDHWGERILAADTVIPGSITALEDSVVLLLPKEDFRRLREALPVLQDYFSGISEERYSPAVRSQQQSEEPPPDGS